MDYCNELHRQVLVRNLNAGRPSLSSTSDLEAAHHVIHHQHHHHHRQQEQLHPSGEKMLFTSHGQCYSTSSPNSNSNSPTPISLPSNLTLSPFVSRKTPDRGPCTSSLVSPTTFVQYNPSSLTTPPSSSLSLSSSPPSQSKRTQCRKISSPIMNLAKIDERRELKTPSVPEKPGSDDVISRDPIISTTITSATPPLSHGDFGLNLNLGNSPNLNQCQNAVRLLGTGFDNCPLRSQSTSSPPGLDRGNITGGSSAPYFYKFRRSDITFGNLIGKGGFGTVYAATIAGYNVAVKIVQKRRGSGIHREILQAERLAFMLNLRHENIVAILGVNVCDELRGDALIVMELLTSQSLQALIDDGSRDINIQQRLNYSLQVSQALHYLHTNSVAHLDLKPANVLMTSDHVCKLSDFGSLTLTGPRACREEPEFTQLLGTLPYRAPELMTGEFPSTKADIYSFGILLWQMLTRESPYKNSNPHVLIYQVVKWDIRPNQPDIGNDVTEVNYKEVYTSCWCRQVEERPCTGELISRFVDMIQCLELER